MKVKISSLKKIGSLRWKGKKSNLPLNLSSVSLVGNYFRDELDTHSHNRTQFDSLANSMNSVCSSEYEEYERNEVDSSRCSSMTNSSQTPSSSLSTCSNSIFQFDCFHDETKLETNTEEDEEEVMAMTKCLNEHILFAMNGPIAIDNKLAETRM